MVNQRLILKNKLDAELRTKIQDAQRVLQELLGTVADLQQNAVQAKSAVSQEIGAVEKLLDNRKQELMQQIDVTTIEQMTALNAEIQSVCLTLGSLQSLLSNLDNCDPTNISVPHAPMSCQKYPSLRVQISSEINDQIKGLGKIVPVRENAVGTSSALPKIENYHQIPNYPLDNFLWKQPSCSASSRRQSERGTELADVEQWLASEKFFTDDADDFEIVSMDIMENRKVLEFRNSKRSSVCGSNMLNCETQELSSDLSFWLQPQDPSTAAYVHDPATNVYVDFPCLRTNLEFWIPEKCSNFFDLEPSFPIRDLVPPEYSFPPSFWVKQTC